LPYLSLMASCNVESILSPFNYMCVSTIRHAMRRELYLSRHI